MCSSDLSAVSASGARPFNPGDIKSENWLCECKTHTKPTDKITITKSVWEKLSNEAKSVMKRPVLFVDNGTQKIEDTWAIVPEYFFRTSISLVSFVKESEKTFTFSHSQMKSGKPKDTGVRISIGNQSLLIVGVEYFKSKIGGD